MSIDNDNRGDTANATRQIVVTGVSSGIGLAIAQHFCRSGYRVFGSVRSAARGDALQVALGDNYHPLVFDVRDRTAVFNSARQLARQLQGGKLNGLINNAGLALFGPMENLDDNAFAEVMQTNVLGTRLTTNAFLPLLQRRASDQSASPAAAARIINISSLSGILNTPMNGSYCVSKHALESLGEIYRRELLPTGIDVVSIRSGPVQSQIWRKNEVPLAGYANSVYSTMAGNARRIMQAGAADALPASAIARLAQKILEKRRCKTSYTLGRGAFIASVLSRLPARLADQLITRALLKD